MEPVFLFELETTDIDAEGPVDYPIDTDYPRRAYGFATNYRNQDSSGLGTFSPVHGSVLAVNVQDYKQHKASLCRLRRISFICFIFWFVFLERCNNLSDE